MAVERYGYSLVFNYNNDRHRWEKLSTIVVTISNTSSKFEVIEEALEIAIRNSPDYFPNAQKILNSISVIEARIIKENTSTDKTLLNASNQNTNREISKTDWVKKIGIVNATKAEEDYKQLMGLPSSKLFNSAIWAGYNRQEQEAVDILKSYEEKSPTGKSN